METKDKPTLDSVYGPGARSYDAGTLDRWMHNWLRAATAAKTNQLDETVSHLARCVKARPDFAKSYLLLGRTYKKMEKIDAAIGVLRQGIANCSSADANTLYDQLIKYEASLAASALLAGGFTRAGLAWQHLPTDTRLIEPADGIGLPEVYNDALDQEDIDERVRLAFAEEEAQAVRGRCVWDANLITGLVRWIADAVVQDQASEVTAVTEEAAELEQSTDVGLSKLPSPKGLGATLNRELTIYTWGDKVVSQRALEEETGCVHHFSAKPLNGRGGGANIKYNATQDPRIVRNVSSSLQEQDSLWLRRVIQAIERDDLTSVSIFCSQGRHRSVSAALILKNRYYTQARFIPIKMK